MYKGKGLICSAIIQTLKCTTTLEKCSVLKAFRSVTKTFRFLLKTFRFVLKRFGSIPKVFRFVLKAFRSVQTVQIVPWKAFRPKRSEVFGSFHCHYQNGELTMKSKAHAPIYFENIFFISYIRTFSVKLLWPKG